MARQTPVETISLYVATSGEFYYSYHVAICLSSLSNVIRLSLNQWYHFCLERRRYLEHVTFYVNGSLLSAHDNVGRSLVHPGGGIYTIGEEQDSLGGGFDFNQAFHGEIAHYNLWDHVLGPEVIAKLYARKGATETGNLISWSDLKSYPIIGDVRILRPSEFFQPTGT